MTAGCLGLEKHPPVIMILVLVIVIVLLVL